VLLKEKKTVALRAVFAFLLALQKQAFNVLLNAKSHYAFGMMAFFFCRGSRIRTCDPLVPNQVR
jgi:hypothetical protein